MNEENFRSCLFIFFFKHSLSSKACHENVFFHTPTRICNFIIFKNCMDSRVYRQFLYQIVIGMYLEHMLSFKRLKSQKISCVRIQKFLPHSSTPFKKLYPCLFSILGWLSIFLRNCRFDQTIYPPYLFRFFDFLLRSASLYAPHSPV